MKVPIACRTECSITSTIQASAVARAAGRKRGATQRAEQHRVGDVHGDERQLRDRERPGQAQQRGRVRPDRERHQPVVPGSPLNGPWRSDVIQPP